MNRKEFINGEYMKHYAAKFQISAADDFEDTQYTSFVRGGMDKAIFNMSKINRVSFWVEPTDPEMEVVHLSNVSCLKWRFPFFKVRCFTIKDDEVIEQKPHRPGQCPYCKYERI